MKGRRSRASSWFQNFKNVLVTGNCQTRESYITLFVSHFVAFKHLTSHDGEALLVSV
jgi:hypothetical protein